MQGKKNPKQTKVKTENRNQLELITEGHPTQFASVRLWTPLQLGYFKEPEDSYFSTQEN